MSIYDAQAMGAANINLSIAHLKLNVLEEVEQKNEKSFKFRHVTFFISGRCLPL